MVLIYLDGIKNIPVALLNMAHLLALILMYHPALEIVFDQNYHHFELSAVVINYQELRLRMPADASLL